MLQKIAIAVFLLIAVPAFAQEEAPVFLEGFPDVPLIAGTEESDGERVVFDTPAGTVAQTVLYTAATPENTVKAYSDALSAFGWTCAGTGTKMACTRDGNRLLFKAEVAREKPTKLILRLEPAK